VAHVSADMQTQERIGTHGIKILTHTKKVSQVVSVVVEIEGKYLIA
jgi:hypothetical protein